jgi:HD superfamily phosphohydrolase
VSNVVQIRDPVHNFIQLREEEAKLISTPLFQRLRGIRQLAMANLVYPGAMHTRFGHSLGVCHVAGLLANRLGLSAEQSELVRLAALLHDLGHGPFSHVSEYALDRYADRSTLKPDQKREKIHELITAHLICNDPEVVRIVGQERCDKIVRLLSEGHGPRALRAIVSGPLDADKQDYLLRDSYFCGVTYGLFDIHQLHRSLLLFGPDHDKELMIEPDGIHAVEQYVLAKYYLTTNVYRHRVRLITDRMIVRAIELGIDVDELKPLRRLYGFDNTARFVENYANWDDARFLHAFGQPSRKPSLCQQLLQRLRERQLLKLVFSDQIRRFKGSVRENIARLGDADGVAVRRRLEQMIAKAIAQQVGHTIEPHFVVVHAFEIKSARVSSRNDEAGILVARPPKPRSFEQESTLFRSIRARYSDAFVEVYAPVTWDSLTARAKLRAGLAQPIRALLESECEPPRKEPEHGPVRLRTARPAGRGRRNKG